MGNPRAEPERGVGPRPRKQPTTNGRLPTRRQAAAYFGSGFSVCRWRRGGCAAAASMARPNVEGASGRRTQPCKPVSCQGGGGCTLCLMRQRCRGAGNARCCWRLAGCSGRRNLPASQQSSNGASNSGFSWGAGGSSKGGRRARQAWVPPALPAHSLRPHSTEPAALAPLGSQQDGLLFCCRLELPSCSDVEHVRAGWHDAGGKRDVQGF